MKRLFCCVLALLLCAAGMSALAETDAGIGSKLRVVNCEEYITLREEPDTSAAALARIPLKGEAVSLGDRSNGFVRVGWKGQSGWALEKYLRDVEESGTAVSLTSQQRYNLNLFLSNFTEVGFCRREGAYSDAWADPVQLTDFAVDHCWFNRQNRLEWGEYFNYNNVRLPEEQIAPIVKKYFGTVVPPEDNKFGALNTAAWSGGSFVYVPKGVHVDIPLQAYFRINTPNMGQFERTLIIADEGSYVHYVEGCTAPIYSTDSLHAAIVEIIVEKNARVRYTTVQNWSNNVYNLVTQRAYVREGATMEWVDGNIGSKATMKYPACILAEPYANASTMSLGFAGQGQYQDTGAKMIHLAPHTSSTIVAKSISRGGGRSAYRGLVKIVDGAEGASSNVVCDALLVDDFSRSDTYPHVDVREDDVSMAHEATVSKVSEDQLFYLMSRGIEEKEAMAMIVRGFVEPISRELPMEYALELNRLVELQMEGSVG